MQAAEVTLEEILRHARLHDIEGNLILAERADRDILAAHCAQPDLLHKPGCTDEATAMDERTTATIADDATHINVGNGYLHRGRLEAVERTYEWPIERDPFNGVERETSDSCGPWPC